MRVQIEVPAEVLANSVYKDWSVYAWLRERGVLAPYKELRNVPSPMYWGYGVLVEGELNPCFDLSECE